MDAKERILEHAAQLLAASPTGDISTRAVCEAAGVTQPVMYRHFGDKDGLLAAVVDHVWGQYLAMKRAAARSADPLDDLYAGWESHVQFALEHPNAYRLLFATDLSTAPESAAEAMGLLTANLERLAERGRLRVTPQEAAQLVMAANTGVALAFLLRPHDYPEVLVSNQLRDALYASLLVTDDSSERGSQDAGRFVAATTLRAGLPATVEAGILSEAESGVMSEWLERIQRQARTG